MEMGLLEKANSLQAVFEPTSVVRTVADLVDELRLELEEKEAFRNSQDFLPCETRSTGQLHTDMEKLKRRIRDLEKGRVVGVDCAVPQAALAAYPYIGLDPLGWRDDRGFPSLVVFPIFARSAGYFGVGTEGMECVLPQELADCYSDVTALLLKELSRRLGRPVRQTRGSDGTKTVLSLQCKFEGLIPSETRAKTLEAQALFGDNMFLIAEPAEPLEIVEWTAPSTIKVDPLVVGWHPLYPSRLWIVDMFDVTPLEAAMALKAKR